MNLERLTKFYLDFCSSHEAYYKLMMAMMYSAKESDTYKVIYPCMQEIIRMLTDMFLKAGDIIGNMRGRQEQYSIGFFGMLNNYSSTGLAEMQKADRNYQKVRHTNWFINFYTGFTFRRQGGIQWL